MWSESLQAINFMMQAKVNVQIICKIYFYENSDTENYQFFAYSVKKWQKEQNFLTKRLLKNKFYAKSV